MIKVEKDKRCSCCNECKELLKFSKNKNRKDGLCNVCKECTAIYRKNNAESISKQRKEFRETNKQKISQSQKEYYNKNRDALLEQKKTYSKENREAKAIYQKEYFFNNKEKLSLQNKIYRETEKGKLCRKNSDHKRRAKIKDGGIESNQLLKIQQCAKACYWCGISLKKVKVHIDHYQPLSKGGEHTESNIVICCSACNLKKHAKDPLVFANSIQRLL